MEHTGLAGQQPAEIRRVDASAVVRVVAQRQEVRHIVAFQFHPVGALRLELVEPFHRAVEAVEPMPRVQGFIDHDADADATGTERNRPDSP